jgi:hypothetical protein
MTLVPASIPTVRMTMTQPAPVTPPPMIMSVERRSPRHHQPLRESRNLWYLPRLRPNHRRSHWARLRCHLCCRNRQLSPPQCQHLCHHELHRPRRRLLHRPADHHTQHSVSQRLSCIQPLLPGYSIGGRIPIPYLRTRSRAPRCPSVPLRTRSPQFRHLKQGRTLLNSSRHFVVVSTRSLVSCDSVGNIEPP